MKTTHAIISLLTVPALCATVCAQDAFNVLEVLPKDGFLQGRAVKPQYSPDLLPILEKVEERFKKLSEEKRQEMLKDRNRDRALEYVPELWDSKEEYNKYLKVWKDTQLINAENVAIGLSASSNPDVWNIISATVDRGKTLPLTLGALTYDAKKNIWKSNNGELVASPFEESDLYIYGAQKGQSWILDKEDSLSRVVESVRMSKTDDGEYIFVYYSFAEISKASGQLLAQGGYTLRFPVKADSATVTKPGQR